jgi:hypothetical protein
LVDPDSPVDDIGAAVVGCGVTVAVTAEERLTAEETGAVAEATAGGLDDVGADVGVPAELQATVVTADATIR